MASTLKCRLPAGGKRASTKSRATSLLSWGPRLICGRPDASQFLMPSRREGPPDHLPGSPTFHPEASASSTPQAIGAAVHGADIGANGDNTEALLNDHSVVLSSSAGRRMLEAVTEVGFKRYLSRIVCTALRNRRKPMQSSIVLRGSHRRIRCEPFLRTAQGRFLREVSGDQPQRRWRQHEVVKNRFREGRLGGSGRGAPRG